MSTASALPQPAEPVADPDEGVEVVVVPVVPAPREPEMARVVARHNARREVVGSVAPGPYEPVGDEIDVDDDSRVVTWTPEHPTSWFRQKDGTPVAIGHVDDHGWVNLDQRLGGGRMLMSALETLADGQSFGPEERLLAAEQARLGEAGFDQKLATILEPAKSPYAIVPGSQNIALFLDGTSNWRDHQTNISTLYDQFQGTKFYYGGVGNAAEYARVDQAKLGGGAGLEFDAIIERAIEDLRENWQPGMRIHVFGFSRGGAEAIELARRLEKHGIKIEGHPENQKPEIAMLGLFDPVYSVGQPGQDSTFTKSTRKVEPAISFRWICRPTSDMSARSTPSTRSEAGSQQPSSLSTLPPKRLWTSASSPACTATGAATRRTTSTLPCSHGIGSQLGTRAIHSPTPSICRRPSSPPLPAMYRPNSGRSVAAGSKAITPSIMPSSPMRHSSGALVPCAATSRSTRSILAISVG